jgi:hypothetical protein
MALVALAAGGVQLASSHSVSSAAGAALAGLLAAGVAALALSLPGVARPGVVIGGLFIGAGISSWTYTERPLVVWLVLLVEGLVFAVWSRPWRAHLRTAVGLGTAWLGTSYWILGVLGALLALRPGLAGPRLLYAGVFGLAVLAVLGKSVRDLSVGVVAAFLVALAVLLLAGSGNLFAAVHVVPANDWGNGFQYRFWGGDFLGGRLLYHPNSIAGVGVLVALRIGPDRAFAAWQRLGALSLAAFLISVTDSRTGFIFLLAAAVVHVFVSYERGRPAVVAPFVALALVLVTAHGLSFLTQERYGAAGGVTSGRLDTWRQVLTDWHHAGLTDKLFGDTSSVRSTVTRAGSGRAIKLTVDNAPMGALRHGGVFGVVAFGVGLSLLLGRLWQRRGTTPPWFVIAVLSALPTMVTTEWLLGGTGGVLWILLTTGEGHLVGPVPLGAGQTTSTGSTSSSVSGSASA